jgi:hypothetical protein
LRSFLNFLRLVKSSLVGRTTPPNSMFSGRKTRQKLLFNCPKALAGRKTSKLSVLGRGVMWGGRRRWRERRSYHPRPGCPRTVTHAPYSLSTFYRNFLDKLQLSCKCSRSYTTPQPPAHNSVADYALRGQKKARSSPKYLSLL